MQQLGKGFSVSIWLLIRRPHYLQASQEVTGRHEFKRLLPGWDRAVLLRVRLHAIEPTLEEQQHTVHDAHDEVRRAAQGANRGDVRRLDRLAGPHRDGKERESVSR